MGRPYKPTLVDNVDNPFSLMQGRSQEISSEGLAWREVLKDEAKQENEKSSGQHSLLC